MVRRNGASVISDTRRFFPWPLRRADSCRNDAGAPSSRSFRPDRTAGMEISCRTFLGDEKARIDRAGRTICASLRNHPLPAPVFLLRRRMMIWRQRVDRTWTTGIPSAQRSPRIKSFGAKAIRLVNFGRCSFSVTSGIPHRSPLTKRLGGARGGFPEHQKLLAARRSCPIESESKEAGGMLQIRCSAVREMHARSCFTRSRIC